MISEDIRKYITDSQEPRLLEICQRIQDALNRNDEKTVNYYSKYLANYVDFCNITQK